MNTTAEAAPATDAPLVTIESLTDAEVNFYQKQGYLTLPGFLRADAVGALRREVLEVVEGAFGLTEDDLRTSRDTGDALRQSSQYLRGSGLDEMINGDRTRGIASRLLGGEAHVYMPFTAVKAGGGGGKFHLHQDNQYTVHEPGEGSLNIWVALVDMTPEIGCLQVSPQSHLEGQIAKKSEEKHGGSEGFITPEQEAHRIFPVRMRAGDAIAFTRMTVHGSGPNSTSDPRVAYALQYHRSDVATRDKETGEMQLLTEHPRYAVTPVDEIKPEDG